MSKQGQSREKLNSMHFCGLQSLCLLNRVRSKKNTLKQVADPLLGAPPKYQGKFSKVIAKPKVMEKFLESRGV